MACKIIVGACLFLLVILVIPIGLTLGFGVSLYTYPKAMSIFAVCYHCGCVLMHLLALSIYVYQQKKAIGFRGIFTNYFYIVTVSGLLLILQLVFSTVGIVFGSIVALDKKNVTCDFNNSTAGPPYQEGTVSMDRQCGMELYFFFGATMALIFRLPTILWGFCEPKPEEPVALERIPRRRNAHRHIRAPPVYVSRLPPEHAVYPAPPPCPPPPEYEPRGSFSASVDQKLPTYEEVTRGSNQQ